MGVIFLNGFLRGAAGGLTFCLLLAGCGGAAAEGPEPAGTPVRLIQAEDTDWRRAYTEFLEALCEEEKAVRNIDRPDYDPDSYQIEVDNLSREYFLCDLDRNGVPELVLRSGWYYDDVRIFTVQSGAVTELGALSGRYMEFYASPDEPGLIVKETPKGPVYVYRITLEDGALRQGAYLYQTPEGVRWDESFRMGDMFPEAEYIQGCRTMINLPEYAPLTLPIGDYGREQAAALDPALDGQARAAIAAVLENGAEFYAVSGDGFCGDAGRITLAEYLQPGGVTEYAERPLVLRRRAWVDLNGDGRRECVLRIETAQSDIHQDAYYVILSEQEGEVYAYCLSWRSSVEIYADGVFCDLFDFAEGWEGGVYRVSFREGQCCQYTAAHDETVPPVEWEALH